MKTGITLCLAVILFVAPTAMAQRRAGAGGPGGGGGGGAPRNAGGGGAPSSSSGASNPSSGGDAGSAAAPANNSSSSSLVSGGDSNGKMWDSVSRAMDSGDFNVDSENGIFTWKGSKFDIGNNLLVRSRFERYLSSPGMADTTQSYQDTLKQISSLLSVDDSSPDKGDKIYQAWQLLFKAKEFPEDGGASETLANQVYNAWRMRDELGLNKDKYETLDTDRRSQEVKVARDGISAQDAAGKAIDFDLAHPDLVKKGIQFDGSKSAPPPMTGSGGQTASGGTGARGGNTGGNTSGNSSSTGSTGSGTVGGDSSNGPSGSLSLSNITIGGPSSNPDASSVPMLPQYRGGGFSGLDAVKLARTYAKQTLLDADTTMMGVQAKLQYQTQLVVFIGQRRFQHSLIAGQFYEHIFKGSQQRMNVAKDEISKFINTDNIVPSVNSFEFISHEAIADVDSGMRAVDNAYNTGDRWTALQQLQQTFLIGEMLPAVQDFDGAKRRVLLNIYRASNDLKHMMDLHDYAGAEATVKKIQADAQDFQAAPILSAIQSGEQTSNLALMAAQQAALNGDTDRFATNMQKATEIWPLNPDLKKFSKTMLDKGDLATVGAAKFDELVARGDDRAIFDSRDELGLAVYQDDDRSAKLKDILHRMGQVEMMVAYADQTMKQNNGYAAWEALVSASAIEPNDPVLARTKAQVAMRVAPFVAALDSADRAEKAGEYAASLNYYLQAQDIYPASQICHDAIENLSMKLMAKLNPGGASAKGLAAEEKAKADAAAADAEAAPAVPGKSASTATSSGKGLF